MKQKIFLFKQFLYNQCFGNNTIAKAKSLKLSELNFLLFFFIKQFGPNDFIGQWNRKSFFILRIIRLFMLINMNIFNNRDEDGEVRKRERERKKLIIYASSSSSSSLWSFVSPMCEMQSLHSNLSAHRWLRLSNRFFHVCRFFRLIVTFSSLLFRNFIIYSS